MIQKGKSNDCRLRFLEREACSSVEKNKERRDGTLITF
jgi:hypothetical protein